MDSRTLHAGVGGCGDNLRVGRIERAEVLLSYVSRMHWRPHLVVHSTGSAGTQAGVVAGFEGARTGIDVLGIGVRAAQAAQEENVFKLACQTAELLGVPGTVVRTPKGARRCLGTRRCLRTGSFSEGHGYPGRVSGTAARNGRPG